MTASLRLIPISKEECRTRLEQKGTNPSQDDPAWLISSSSSASEEEYNRPRNPLTLKLCDNTDDIIDVDDEAHVEHEVVKYASKFQDGSVAAIVSLGRNYATGIKWTSVSRALCDVSLTNSGGGRKEVAMVDLADSPPELVAASSTTSSNPGGGGGANDEETVTAAAFLSMRKPAGKHLVYLDGELVKKPLGRDFPLANGSIIALYGPSGFAYEVVISQNDKEEDDAGAASPKKRKAVNPPTTGEQKASPSPIKEKQPAPHQELRQRAHKLMIGECTCAMCMDILVKSTFAYPCGHAFCEECSNSVTNAAASTMATTNSVTRAAAKKKGTCPTCRGDVDGWMPARSFDTMVWATALQGCFERDDAEFYLERREGCGEDAPTEHERECILNSAEGGGKNLDSGVGRYLLADPSLHKPTTNLIRTMAPLFPTTSNNGNANNLNNKSRNLGMTSNDDVICID